MAISRFPEEVSSIGIFKGNQSTESYRNMSNYFESHHQGRYLETMRIHSLPTLINLSRSKADFVAV